jgi:hypothetical protein
MTAEFLVASISFPPTMNQNGSMSPSVETAPSAMKNRLSPAVDFTFMASVLFSARTLHGLSQRRRELWSALKSN